MVVQPDVGTRRGAFSFDLHDVVRRLPASAQVRWNSLPGDRLWHLDLHAQNVICTADGPVLIDRANARAGPGSVPAASVSCCRTFTDHLDAKVGGMCRNITTLRGLEPAATSEEIHAAALQYVRKVTGVGSLSELTREPIERAAAEIARLTAAVLEELPQRRVPPKIMPPLRRPEVRARLAGQ